MIQKPKGTRDLLPTESYRWQDAEKKVKSLNDKLDEAARKRQSSSIVKDQLQETRKKLQAEKDQAEAEDKAAKEAQKAIGVFTSLGNHIPGMTDTQIATDAG